MPKKTAAQIQREIDEALRKGPQGASPCPVNVGDFVSFKSKYDGATIKGRVAEVAWLGGDHWSAMVKMASRPGNAIVRVDDLTKLSKNSRSHATMKTKRSKAIIKAPVPRHARELRELAASDKLPPLPR